MNFPLRRTRPGSACAALLTAWIVSACAPAASGAVAAVPAPRTGAQEDLLLPVRYDAGTGKLFLTVPRFGEEILYLNTLAAGLGTAGLDRGQLGPSGIVRFERNGERVHLVLQNTAHRAGSGDPAARRAVEESFPSSVLAAFPVESEGPDGTVVDATAFFLSDVYDVAGSVRGAGAGALRTDPARSYIDPANSRSF
ncbi:MAG TPA: DUF5117 domain-containing protein, partial [Longimicrobiaceae bacterium]|nr:DUF5117 domain-containing protein [Longimicrobiaceae bacterium]